MISKERWGTKTNDDDDDEGEMKINDGGGSWILFELHQTTDPGNSRVVFLSSFVFCLCVEVIQGLTTLDRLNDVEWCSTGARRW